MTCHLHHWNRPCVTCDIAYNRTLQRTLDRAALGGIGGDIATGVLGKMIKDKVWPLKR